jgi:hypothetical protein
MIDKNESWYLCLHCNSVVKNTGELPGQCQECKKSRQWEKIKQVITKNYPSYKPKARKEPKTKLQAGDPGMPTIEEWNNWDYWMLLPDETKEEKRVKNLQERIENGCKCKCACNTERGEKLPRYNGY